MNSTQQMLGHWRETIELQSVGSPANEETNRHHISPWLCSLPMESRVTCATSSGKKMRTKKSGEQRGLRLSKKAPDSLMFRNMGCASLRKSRNQPEWLKRDHFVALVMNMAGIVVCRSNADCYFTGKTKPIMNMFFDSKAIAGLKDESHYKKF